ERAIAKGAGTYEGDDANYEEIRYEGYGACGVAILIEALTDNRNRTAADLRAAFSKNGGNLGETGCVGWMFEQKGVVRLVGKIDEDLLLEASMEGGADTYELTFDEDNPGAEVFTEVANLDNLDRTLQAKGFSPQEVELRWIANNTIEVTDFEMARSLIKLIDTLESLEDVQNVTANLEMTQELMTAEVF
ncbi:MAG: YebC/PmpR family DNA-binding transcriptional regulator, partial [Xenococcaceae cyanobacterium]